MINWLLSLSQTWPMGTAPDWLLRPFNMSRSFFECFLALCDNYIPGSFDVFPAPALESTISPRSLGSFYWRRENVCFPVKDVITETVSPQHGPPPISSPGRSTLEWMGLRLIPQRGAQRPHASFLVWKESGWGVRGPKWEVRDCALCESARNMAVSTRHHSSQVLMGLKKKKRWKSWASKIPIKVKLSTVVTSLFY